eukprot:jgi/Psemu1/31571/gm1.31571_g
MRLRCITIASSVLLKMHKPLQARLVEETRTGKLSRVSPACHSEPPDLKRYEPLQATRLEQTRTRKLRSDQVSPNQLTSNDLSPLEAITVRTMLSCARDGAEHVKITKPVLFWKANLKTTENIFLVQELWQWCTRPVHERIMLWGMKDGIVPLKPGGLTLKELYVMCPEYAEYAYKKSSSQVLSLWKSIKKNMPRAEEDKADFDMYGQTCSESQQLLRNNLAEALVNQMKKIHLCQSREEYHTREYPLNVFPDKVNQEIKTAKCLHTLRVHGEQYKSS